MTSVRIIVARGLLLPRARAACSAIKRSRRTPPHVSSREMSPAPTQSHIPSLAATCLPVCRPPLLPPRLRAGLRVDLCSAEPAGECCPLVASEPPPPSNRHVPSRQNMALLAEDSKQPRPLALLTAPPSSPHPSLGAPPPASRVLLAEALGWLHLGSHRRTPSPGTRQRPPA